MAVNRDRIEYEGIHAYRAQPETLGAGGVLLLPTIFGLNYVCDYADWLAESGFATLVWDPYPGEAPITDIHIAAKRASKLQDDALDAFSRLADYMLGPMRLAKIGTLGFCMGGRFNLLFTSHDRRLSACVPIYPSLPEDGRPNQSLDAVALAANIARPVQLVYPGRDHVTSYDTFVRLNTAAAPGRNDRTVSCQLSTRIHASPR